MALTSYQRQKIDQYMQGSIETLEELGSLLSFSEETTHRAVARRMSEKQKVRKYINLYRADRLSI